MSEHHRPDPLAVLNDPATYRADPEQAWRRLKPRGSSPRMLATLKEVAAWREDSVTIALLRCDAGEEVDRFVSRDPEVLALCRDRT